MQKASDITRMTKLAFRAANGRGVKCGVYADAVSFDVLTEGARGVFWVRSDMAQAYRAPASVARHIIKQIRAAWD